ncbi:MAG: IS1182 family transposase [bacterium]|nr:IS1182 family transposase [bacterium]
MAHKKVSFKKYQQHQMSLLPPSLEELIPADHPVRVVNGIIDQLDIDSLLKQYKGGGSSSFHPKMLLKVLVYSYVSNVYSSRKIEAAIKEHIHFMWLAGMNTPDHNTINRFRSEKLGKVLKEVFGQVVGLLVQSGHVSLQEAYLDGTKIEANANRYTFVWGRSIKYNKERIAKQLEELWHYAQTVASEELKDTAPVTFEKISPQQVKQTVEQINEALKGKPVDKKVKQKLNYAKKNWPQNLDKYEQQEKMLNGRNSCSKTDPDATFMRLKDDHMQNGQLKPAYNWQISTNDQFILNYSIHQTSTDPTTLPAHLEQFKALHGKLPEVLVADAGYGSQQNYEYLEQNEVDAYVKFGNFHKEQKGEHLKKNPFHQDHLHYNKDRDCFYCPMGQPMEKSKEYSVTTANGFKQKIVEYQARNCAGCPLAGPCHKSKSNRTIQVNHHLRRYKEQTRQKLLSEQGVRYRKKRPADVEAVFGNIKSNHGFKRFSLRGLEKVEIEAGLMALAHNLRKSAA